VGRTCVANRRLWLFLARFEHETVARADHIAVGSATPWRRAVSRPVARNSTTPRRIEEKLWAAAFPPPAVQRQEIDPLGSPDTYLGCAEGFGK
jgi:hypothetical protein